MVDPTPAIKLARARVRPVNWMVLMALCAIGRKRNSNMNSRISAESTDMIYHEHQTYWSCCRRSVESLSKRKDLYRPNATPTDEVGRRHASHPPIPDHAQDPLDLFLHGGFLRDDDWSGARWHTIELEPGVVRSW